MIFLNKLNEDVDRWRLKTISQVILKKGDEIKLTAIADGKEIERLDYMNLKKNNHFWMSKEVKL